MRQGGGLCNHVIVTRFFEAELLNSEEQVQAAKVVLKVGNTASAKSRNFAHE